MANKETDCGKETIKPVPTPPANKGEVEQAVHTTAEPLPVLTGAAPPVSVPK